MIVFILLYAAIHNHLAIILNWSKNNNKYQIAPISILAIIIFLKKHIIIHSLENK